MYYCTALYPGIMAMVTDYVYFFLLQKIHSRLGELLYTCASDGDAPRLLGRSVQHFSRSIELCDDYLRGFYGLILVCQQ